jgi:hypothetical protein
MITTVTEPDVIKLFYLKARVFVPGKPFHLVCGQGQEPTKEWITERCFKKAKAKPY